MNCKGKNTKLREKYIRIRMVLDTYDQKKHGGDPIAIEFYDDGTYKIIGEKK